MQLDRLPTSKPELHFAAKALSFSEQTMTIGKCWGLLLLGTACVWSMQPDGVFRSELGLMAVVLFLGANFLMLEETTTANPNWLKALSVLDTFGFFIVAGFAVSVAHPLLAAVGLGAFVWLFGMHAVDIATTAPMPLAEATRHRKGAASYFAVMALAPAALSLLPLPHRAVGVVAMAGVAALTALLDEGSSSFGCLLTSWRDWLTYNRYETT